MRKIAFITGATAGFGKASAYIFAANGYDLIINGRRIEKLQVSGQFTEGERFCYRKIGVKPE